jgi:hypothetical protein
MNGNGNCGEACHDCGLYADGPDIPLGGHVDPCIAPAIPGVIHACCGHGDTCQPYVVLANATPGTSCTETDHLLLTDTAALFFFELVRRARARYGGTQALTPLEAR